ncbi:MAG: 50S ribosomal protein L31 [Anaerolineales bacterium]
MKNDIHPTYYEEAKIVCMACGTEWVMGSTRESLRVDVCANCHPFYTGEQKIVDTEGRVDRFLNRLRVRDQREADRRAKEEARLNADVPLDELELSKRYINILNEAGINTVADLIQKLNDEGDDAVLEIPGIGVKVLADAKRKMSEIGYTKQQSGS